MSILPNVVISATRSGAALYMGRRVQIDTVPLHRSPTIPGADNLAEVGPLLFATLYDAPSSMGWQPGDQVTIIGKTGFTAQQVGTRFGVYTAAEMGGRLPYVTATLVTIPTFTTTVTLRRGTYNATTKQTTPKDVSPAVLVYLRDLSNEFRLRGVAAEFEMQLLADGTADIRDGDQLTGLTATTLTARAPVLTVQHVALHHLAGWPYKTATVRVQL